MIIHSALQDKIMHTVGQYIEMRTIRLYIVTHTVGQYTNSSHFKIGHDD